MVKRLVACGLWLVGGMGLSSAQTADIDSLLSALRKSATFTVRGQASVTLVFPPRKPPTRTVGALPPVPFLPALIRRNFNVSRTEPETVARREAQVFTLTPKVGAAASWRLWIDREWNVPLAYEERSADGTLARRATMLSADKLQKRGQPLPLSPAAGLGQVVSRALPGLKLPPGFVPLRVGQRPAGPEVIFSDGLNVLALVFADRQVKSAPGVATRRIGKGFVWLIGNLDNDALDAALAGIKARNPEALGTFVPPGNSNP